MNEMLIRSWRNGFQAMTDAELEDACGRPQARALMLRDAEGRPKREGYEQYMDMLLAVMKAELGAYTARTDENILKGYAKSWARKLEPEYIRVGIEGIAAAVRAWVDDDASEYMRFPKAAWIAEKCAQLKGSPEHERGLRQQQAEEARIDAEHQMAMEKYKAEHPQHWKEIEEEAQKRFEAQHGRQEGLL